MKLKHILTSLILLLNTYPAALVQGDRPLRVVIADAVKAHEPAWLLEEEPAPSGYSEDCKCERMTLTWKQAGGRGGVLAFVYAHESSGDARAAYESLAEDWALEKVKDVSRPDLGIEHLKTRAGEFQGVKFSQLLFRRGRVAVVLWGLDTGPGVAERFASFIAAEVPAA